MNNMHLPYDDEDEEASPEEMEGLNSIGITLISIGVIFFVLVSYFLF